jgi:hypothetical protein
MCVLLYHFFWYMLHLLIIFSPCFCVSVSDLDFNPKTDVQAEDRCHRIGQSKQVKIYTLIAKGTVDEYVASVGERKQRMDSYIMDGGSGSAGGGGGAGGAGGAAGSGLTDDADEIGVMQHSSRVGQAISEALGQQ